jgi:hypothetical protein
MNLPSFPTRPTHKEFLGAAQQRRGWIDPCGSHVSDAEAGSPKFPLAQFT